MSARWERRPHNQWELVGIHAVSAWAHEDLWQVSDQRNGADWSLEGGEGDAGRYGPLVSDGAWWARQHRGRAVVELSRRGVVRLVSDVPDPDPFVMLYWRPLEGLEFGEALVLAESWRTRFARERFTDHPLYVAIGDFRYFQDACEWYEPGDGARLGVSPIVPPEERRPELEALARFIHAAAEDVRQEGAHFR